MNSVASATQGPIKNVISDHVSVLINNEHSWLWCEIHWILTWYFSILMVYTSVTKTNKQKQNHLTKEKTEWTTFKGNWFVVSEVGCKHSHTGADCPLTDPPTYAGLPNYHTTLTCLWRRDTSPVIQRPISLFLFHWGGVGVGISLVIYI